MEMIGAIVGPIVLVGMLLVFFGMIMGVKADKVATTYFNLIAQVLVVIGQALIKITIPILKVLGQKIVYAANHYLAEHKKESLQITQDKEEKSDNQTIYTKVPEPEPIPKNEQQPKTKQEKPSSANPYDDPPEPEIMD